MRLTTVVIAGAFFLGICSCSQSGSDGTQNVQRPLPTPHLNEMVGAKAIGILQSPDRIESFRIAQRREPIRAGTINGYPLSSIGPVLSSEQIDRVRQLVIRLESYIPLGAKACGPIQPVVALRFHRGEESVTALICFSCKEWMFVAGNDEAKTRSWNLEGCQQELLAICQELFPDDTLLAGIKPLDSYGAAYHLIKGPPVEEDELNRDLSYDRADIDVLAKYLPDVRNKVTNWSRGRGFGDTVFRLDGVLHVYTTAEKHAVIAASKLVQPLK